MKPNNIKNFLLAAAFFAAFLAFTLVVGFVDVKPIGPRGSRVGLAALNGCMRDLLGVRLPLYYLTDWASLLAVLVAFGFAALGLFQLLKRKSLWKVDSSILVLGAFYCLVFGAYAFFEVFVVNYRPIVINGVLEASYPSSTTLLVLCILPTAMLQFRRLIKNRTAQKSIHAFCGVFTALMVLGRLFSGVHWFTDIVGGVLLGAALVLLYAAFATWIDSKTARHTL